MTSPAFPSAEANTAHLQTTSNDQIDAILTRLQGRKDAWVATPIGERISLRG
ncbi:MAG: hypothetical protein IPL79_06135 [Myxococcales bacterium]|nr:hypothetical protein [Myxococcales bacterium]